LMILSTVGRIIEDYIYTVHRTGHMLSRSFMLAATSVHVWLGSLCGGPTGLRLARLRWLSGPRNDPIFFPTGMGRIPLGLD
jgi:hypothetical protein